MAVLIKIAVHGQGASNEGVRALNVTPLEILTGDEDDEVRKIISTYSPERSHLSQQDTTDIDGFRTVHGRRLRDR